MALDGKAAALEAALESLGGRLPGVGPGLGAEGLAVLAEGLPLLLETPGPAPSLLLDAGWEGTREILLGVVARMRRRNELRQRLFAVYEKRVLALDLDALHRRLAGALDTWPPMSWIGIWRVKGAVRPAARGGAVPPAAQLLGDLEAARELRDLEEGLRSDPEPARLLGGHWKGGEADPDAVEAQVAWAGKFRSFLHRFIEASAPGGEGRPAWVDLAAGEPAGRPLRDLLQRLAAFEEERRELSAFLELDGAAAWGGNEEPGHLARVRAACAAWASSGPRLHHWCAWRRIRMGVAAAGLDPLAAACEKGEVPPHLLPEAFARGFFQWWFETVLRGEPVLRDFFSADHEERIREFRELDARVLELTRGVVIARLAARVPQARAGSAPASSEVGILLHEAKLKRGHMAIRELVGKVPNLLPLLKPCLLMSPLSVAQYLDPAFAKVDLVVFDEASQIPVWDSVGAIARGRQVVVVGDSKQLPPTMFFEKEEAEEEVEEGEFQELESVLDTCFASQVPRLYLEWHYRSRHESLIAFSNHHYYENRLLTFPSSVKESPRVGVSLVRVPGVYDRGTARTNRAEADAVVAEILRRLRDPAERHRSLGVVTFSQVQQTLIEDLLEEARAQDLSIDPWFSDAVPEPVFIKNLENVQGDERDVILFSVCYGPDAAGKMMMNFGPLNLTGGERRLNVAVTRAREQVVVFSSIGPEAIDLSRTRAKGVADLKTFLDYAARGPVALVSAAGRGRGVDHESPLEKAVADALRARGWEVEAQVGCSGYRIDLAVKDPLRPGEYLCGIECDGASYHSARTARDRDRLREEVLRRLGWSILRVWSTDWWYEPEKVTANLDRRLGALRDAAKARGRDPLDLGHTNPLEAAPPPAGEAPPTPRPEAPRPVAGGIAGAAAAVLPGQSEYRAWREEARRGTPEGFHEPGQDGVIAGLVRAVVAAEGPVAIDLACRRVAGAWTIERVTDRVRRRILEVVQGSCPEVRIEGMFLWARDRKAEGFSGFRVPGPDPASVREAEEIPAEEAANAAAALLPRLVSLPRRDLVREMAKTFGFQRLGRRVEERMEQGVALLAARGGCSVAEDVVSLSRRDPV
jgi:very-short-patch-repair endonuclease